MLLSHKAGFDFVVRSFDVEAEMRRSVFVSLDPEKEAVKPVMFGRTLDMGDAAFKAPEILMSKLPKFVSKNVRDTLLVAGGTTAMPGLFERLSMDLKKLGSRCNVVRAKHPSLGAWIGATIVARSPEAADTIRIPRSLYEEVGSAVFSPDRYHPRAFYSPCFVDLSSV